MKYAIIALTAFSLAACKDNQGVHKGTLEKECSALNGTFARVSENEYTCTIPDGVVLKSTDKK
jgi:hypothetical protein